MVEVLELTPGDLLREGFHVQLNADALNHAPRVYLIKNNGFADGVALPLAFANPCLVDLAPAYRLRGARVNFAQLDVTLARAKELCAEGHGPFILECLIRERAHE